MWPHALCLRPSILHNVQHNPFWLEGVKVRLRMACATSCCVVYVTVDGVRCKWIALLRIIKVVWIRMLCCYVSVVIKSECFIEWRFSPNFLLISMKSVVFSNAEVKMMWLMKARCGLLQSVQTHSSQKWSYSVALQDKLICGSQWNIIHGSGNSGFCYIYTVFLFIFCLWPKTCHKRL